MSSFHVVLSPFNIALFWLFFFSGYLYAHISYLEDNCPACLLLLSTDRNAFFELAGSRQKTLEVSKVFEVWKFEKRLRAVTHDSEKNPARFPFAILETIRELEPKCFPQLFLGSWLGTRRSAIGQIFSLPGNITRSLCESELDPVTPFLQLWIFWERVLWFFSVWKDTGV